MTEPACVACGHAKSKHLAGGVCPVQPWPGVTTTRFLPEPPFDRAKYDRSVTEEKAGAKRRTLREMQAELRRRKQP